MNPASGVDAAEGGSIVRHRFSTGASRTTDSEVTHAAAAVSRFFRAFITYSCDR
jgi:hypothetical protein